MDKRSESQFAAAASTVQAPAMQDGNWVRKGSPRVHAGTRQEVMQSVASQGRLFQEHNEGPRSLIKEGEPKWGVDVNVSTRPGGPTRDTTTKEGRRGVAADLGLPNVKRKRRG